MALTIHLITAAQTHPLRSLVLRPGQPPGACVWPGDEAAGSFHLGAFVDGELVGIASVMKQPLPNQFETDLDTAAAYRLRGMATHPDHRRQGQGTALLDECIERVRQAGGDVLWCNARTSAVEFYHRHGFQTIGDEFEVSNIGPHAVMWLDLRLSI